jgi:hypothetical protein
MINREQLAADVEAAAYALRHFHDKREGSDPLRTETPLEYWCFAYMGLKKDEFSLVADFIECGRIRDAMGLMALRAYEFGEKQRPSKWAKNGGPEDPSWKIALGALYHERCLRKDAAKLLRMTVAKWPEKLRDRFLAMRGDPKMKPMPKGQIEGALKIWPFVQRRRT